MSHATVAAPALRARPGNRNHHLWNNNGTRQQARHSADGGIMLRKPVVVR